MEPERQHATGDSATAREPSFPDAGSAPSDPRELDCLYLEADRIYYGFARRCGLSNCAYWMMYDIERADGPIALADLTSSWAYSKQTINSAIKSLEARGLIELSYAEGSRRNKTAAFTAAGRSFAERYIVPAQDAERRAFCSLAPADRAAILRLARAYTRALSAELERMEALPEESGPTAGAGSPVPAHIDPGR